MDEKDAKIDTLSKRLEELIVENTELKAEIVSIHTILDGTRLVMPADFEELKPNEQTRACTAAGRVQQFLMALTACPHRVKTML